MEAELARKATQSAEMDERMRGGKDEKWDKYYLKGSDDRKKF